MTRDTSGTPSTPQLVAMFCVMTFHPTDESTLPVGRGAILIGAYPAFEFGMERVKIPAWTFAAQEVDGLVRHEPARRIVRQTCDGGTDQPADIDGAVR